LIKVHIYTRKRVTHYFAISIQATSSIPEASSQALSVRNAT